MSVEVSVMTYGHPLWDKTISFADNCSWKAGSYLAHKMRNKEFSETERVAEDSMFGNRDVYGNEFLTDLLSGEIALSETYGIRAFFGLSSNNEIKYTDDWYKSMLELEAKASTMDEFRKIAFFNHLIFKKKS